MMFFKKKAKMLKLGAPAPAFALQDHNGKTVTSASLAGKRVLLWFYPKADTPGCTAEGQGFCARMPELSDGMVVLGVSFDGVDDNRAFAEKHAFPFGLLCDTDRAMSMAYGAAASAKDEYPERITYVIDADGDIEWAEKVGDIEAHVHAAIAHLRDA